MTEKTIIKLNNEPNIPENVLLEKGVDENMINTKMPNFENLELDEN